MYDVDAPPLTGAPTRESFARTCRVMYDRRLVVGAGGNLSVRFEDGFLTTPSGLSLRDMTPGQALAVGPDGSCEGSVKPSKELSMHLRIFLERPDVQVVTHVHGSYITALTTLLEAGDDTLPPLCPGHVYYTRPLPMLPFYIPGTQELAGAVGERFANPDLLALLLKNHGLIAVGATLAEAVNTAEEVDEAAMMYLHTRGGDPATLADEDVEILMAQRREAYARRGADRA
jgi:L-fuculose-phosphate aldolase